MAPQSSDRTNPPRGTDDTMPMAPPTAPMVHVPGTIADPPPQPLPPDNLLLAAVIGQPIKLTLDDFPLGTVVDDEVQLKVQGGYLPYVPVTALGGGLHAELTLPDTETTRPGTYAIQYRMHYQSGLTDISPVQTYVIDDTPPGGARLAPLATTFPLTDGIDFSQFPNGIPFDLFGYEGMAPGDSIQCFLDGVAVGNPAIVPSPLPGNAQPLQVTLKMDTPPTDGAHTFAYSVTDRPKHAPVMSEPVTIRTIAAGITLPLVAPLLPGAPNATDNLIDFRDAHASGGAAVHIPYRAGLIAGDMVTVRWAGRSIGPLRVANTSEPADPALVTSVPYGEIFADWHATSGGADMAVATAVTYELWRAGVRAGSSAPADIRVNLYVAGGGGIEDPDPETPAHEALMPPEVRSALGNVNDIPADQYKQSGEVRIPRTTTVETGSLPVLEEADVIHVSFGPNALAAVTYNQAADPNPGDDYYAVTLPPEKIDGTAGNVDVSYVIERAIDGGKGFVLSPSATVTVSNPDDAPDGSVKPLPVEWTNQKSLTKGLALLPDATVSVNLNIPVYQNKRVGDEITLTADFYYGKDPDDDSQPVRTVTRQHAVTKAEVITGSDIALTWDDLIPDPAVNAQMHAHIEYLVVSTEGATSMISDEWVLLIDTRFAEDWIDRTNFLGIPD